MAVAVMYGAPFLPKTPQYQKLANSAYAYQQRQQPDLAVIMAQTACELLMEQAIAVLLERRGVADLEAAIAPLLSSYNPTNEKVRRLYVALSGDQITQEHFWKALRELADCRSKVVHKGKMPSDAQALAAVQAMWAFTGHVRKVIDASVREAKAQGSASDAA